MAAAGPGDGLSAVLISAGGMRLEDRLAGRMARSGLLLTHCAAM
ncbi:hypothetical protein [Paracoccus halophilus]|nr:hypothetical protein [Paracoccus halophilus]